MGKLLQNERIKLYRKPSTWILMGVILLLMAASLLLSRATAPSAENLDWEEGYTNTLAWLQIATKENPTDLYLKYQLKEVQYLCDNQIPPTDWRCEVIYRLCEAERQIETIQMGGDISYEMGEDISYEFPDGMPDVEELQALADRLDAVLDSGNWADYVALQVEELEASEALTGAELQVEKEIFQLYVDHGITPLPSQGQFSWYGYRYPELSWRNDQIQTIRENKLTLLSGVLNEAPIDRTTRAKLQQEIDVAIERLQTDTPPVSVTGFAGLMDGSTGWISLISLLAIVFAGGLVASEFHSGTIKLLLITPHRRAKVFWAKVLLMLEVIGFTALAMFVVAFLLSGVLTGFDDLTAVQVLPLFGHIVRMPYLLLVALKYVLYLVPVVLFMSLSLLLSTVTRNSAVAIAVSLLLMYGGQMVITLMASLSSELGIVVPGAAFLPFASTDLSVYLPSASSSTDLLTAMGLSGTVDPHMTLGFSLIVLLVYIVCFLWIARDSFCRRDIR